MDEQTLLTRIANLAAANTVYEFQELERTHSRHVETFDSLLRKRHLAIGDQAPLVVPTVLGLVTLSSMYGEHIHALVGCLRYRYKTHPKDAVLLSDLEKPDVWTDSGVMPPITGNLTACVWALSVLTCARVIFPGIDKVDGESHWEMRDFAINRDILRFPSDPKSIIELENIQASKVSSEMREAVRLNPPDLAFVTDASLRTIIERDHVEIQDCLALGAWKAVIILSGSALEGLLLDRIMANEKQARDADPTLSQTVDRWTLGKMIDVAHKCGWLSKVTQMPSHGVREFRNLVHPHKEVSGDHKIDGPEAGIAARFLDAVIRDLRESS